MGFVVWSFYCFKTMPELVNLKLRLMNCKSYQKIKGTIIIANEGFNGSIAGHKDDVEAAFADLVELTSAHKDLISLKSNDTDFVPFSLMKFKIKNEIVSMGIQDLDMSNRGRYVKPEQWDGFISQPDVVVVDTRNNYEFEFGHFKNAIDPQTKSFREFPQWFMNNIDLFKNKKLAMYCTGGIRCEKSTAYAIKALGHDQVYHLDGGILQYLQDTGNTSGVWEKECFVFDDRCSVQSDLSPTQAFCDRMSWLLK